MDIVELFEKDYEKQSIDLFKKAYENSKNNQDKLNSLEFLIKQKLSETDKKLDEKLYEKFNRIDQTRFTCLENVFFFARRRKFLLDTYKYNLSKDEKIETLLNDLDFLKDYYELMYKFRSIFKEYLNEKTNEKINDTLDNIYEKNKYLCFFVDAHFGYYYFHNYYDQLKKLNVF